MKIFIEKIFKGRFIMSTSNYSDSCLAFFYCKRDMHIYVIYNQLNVNQKDCILIGQTLAGSKKKKKRKEKRITLNINADEPFSLTSSSDVTSSIMSLILFSSGKSEKKG